MSQMYSPTHQQYKMKQAQYREKAKQIKAVLDQPEIDLWQLRALAISEGGLVKDSLRRRAWPKLVGLPDRVWNEPPSGPKKKGPTVNTQDLDTGSSSLTPKSSNFTVTRSKAAIAKALENEGAVVPPTSPRRPPRPEHHYRSTSCSSIVSANTTNDAISISSSTHSVRDMVLASSLDWAQIDLDAARCTWHLLTGSQRAQRDQMEQKRMKRVARAIRRKQRRLANLINLTLVLSYKRCGDGTATPKASRAEKDNTLRYYQGYHDVACIILSTLGGCRPVRVASGILSSSNNTLEGMAVATGLEMPAAVLLQLSHSHFRDCMRANFVQLQTALQLTMLPLLAYFDPPVHAFLQQCEMEPFFALSWVITWFSHDIRDTDLVKRLFDFFVVSHPLMPIYLAVAMVTHPLNRQDVLQSCDDGDDFAAVHHALSSLPRNSSMVGWKYSPGGEGYVSDDGDDDLDDDDYDDWDESPSSSIAQMDSQSSVDTDFLRHESLQGANTATHNSSLAAGAEAVSIVSSSMSSMFAARVPFQELIDSAIHLIERMPPQSLIGLATRYYGRAKVQEMVTSASNISLFQAPPTWTRAPSAKSDRGKVPRRRSGGSALVRNRSTSSLQSVDSATSTSSWRDDNEPVVDLVDTVEVLVEKDIVKRLYSQDRSKAMAAIAAGLSKGDDAERRRKKQRKRMVLVSVTVALVAIAVGTVLQGRSLQQLSKASPNGAGGIAHVLDFALVEPDAVTDTCSSSLDSLAILASSPVPREPSREDEIVPATRQSSKTQPKLALKVHQAVSPWSRVEADRRDQNNPSTQLAHVPEIDVLVTVLVKLVVHEALVIGDHIQHAGATFVMPQLKQLASKSKNIVAGTRHALQRGQLQAAALNLPRPDIALFRVILQKGLERSANVVKANAHGLQRAVVAKTLECVGELRSAVSLAATDYEDEAPLPNIESFYSQTTMNTRLRMLDQEFHLPDFTNAVSHSMDNLMRSLVPALHKLRTKIVLDVKGSLRKIARPESAREAIRAASIASLYTSSVHGSAKQEERLPVSFLPQRTESLGLSIPQNSPLENIYGNEPRELETGEAKLNPPLQAVEPPTLETRGSIDEPLSGSFQPTRTMVLSTQESEEQVHVAEV